MNHYVSLMAVCSLMAACSKEPENKASPVENAPPTPAPTPTPTPTPQATATTAATPGTAAAPAAEPTKCSPGYYGHANPGFCIKLPEGSKWSRDESFGSNTGLAHFETASPSGNIEVGWSEQKLDEAVESAEVEAKNIKAKLEKKGALSKGRVWSIRTDLEPTGGKALATFQVRVLVSTPTGTLRCNAGSMLTHEKDKDVVALVDACKTLEVP
ncbi:MAG: hypothetical protein U0263_13795 [Polyangiaceae bacterium]